MRTRHVIGSAAVSAVAAAILSGCAYSPALSQGRMGLTCKPGEQSAFMVTTRDAIVGSWHSTARYKQDSAGDPARWNWQDNLLALEADGRMALSVARTYPVAQPPCWGYWLSFRDSVLLTYAWLWPQESGGFYGINCHFLKASSNGSFSGVFEDGDPITGWWGQGESLLTKASVQADCGAFSYRPGELSGEWEMKIDYTGSSNGGHSAWSKTRRVRLDPDGSVGSGETRGMWWSVRDLIVIAQPWQTGEQYGVECSVLRFPSAATLRSASHASGKVENKDMSGTGWWGFGRATLTRK